MIDGSRPFFISGIAKRGKSVFARQKYILIQQIWQNFVQCDQNFSSISFLSSKGVVFVFDFFILLQIMGWLSCLQAVLCQTHSYGLIGKADSRNLVRTSFGGHKRSPRTVFRHQSLQTAYTNAGSKSRPSDSRKTVRFPHCVKYFLIGKCSSFR